MDVIDVTVGGCGACTSILPGRFYTRGPPGVACRAARWVPFPTLPRTRSSRTSMAWPATGLWDLTSSAPPRMSSRRALFVWRGPGTRWWHRPGPLGGDHSPAQQRRGIKRSMPASGSACAATQTLPLLHERGFVSRVHVRGPGRAHDPPTSPTTPFPPTSHPRGPSSPPSRSAGIPQARAASSPGQRRHRRRVCRAAARV